MLQDSDIHIEELRDFSWVIKFDGLVKSQYLDDFEKSALNPATAGRILRDNPYLYLRSSAFPV